jgi:hypothetical protein
MTIFTESRKVIVCMTDFTTKSVYMHYSTMCVSQTPFVETGRMDKSGCSTAKIIRIGRYLPGTGRKEGVGFGVCGE